MRRAPCAALALLLLAPAVTARPLSTDEVEALRNACLRVNAQQLELGTDEAVLREVRVASSWLPDDSLAAIAQGLARDPAVRSGVAELLSLRTHWRQRPTDLFLFWWDPDQRAADGLPSRAPTREEVEQLEAWTRAVAASFGVEPPVQMPYRVDKRQSGSRAWPRSDLRWGVASARLDDRRAVAAALLLDLTDAPYLVAPLALEAAECAPGDAACRGRLVERARDAVVRGGYVPILRGLAAETVGDLSDPALASGLLVLDRVRRERPPAALAELLRTVRKGQAEPELRETLRRILREGPSRLDQEVQRELQEWAARSPR